MSTLPVIARSVPVSIGVRLKRPLAGCQSESVNQRVKPTWRRAGRASPTSSSAIRNTNAAATAPNARSVQSRTRSAIRARRCARIASDAVSAVAALMSRVGEDRDEVLVLDDVLHVLRPRVLDELLRQPRGRALRHQVQWTR